MNREQLKNQVNSKIVNDELSEEEMMHDIMQMVDAHVTEQLRIGGVSISTDLIIQNLNKMDNLKTRQQIAFNMYKLNFNQLTDHQKDMVDYEFKVQY